MHAGRDDFFTGFHPGTDFGLSGINPAEADLALFHARGLAVQHPDVVLAAFVEDGRQRQLRYGGFGGAALGCHAGAHAQAHVGIGLAQRQAGGIGAGGCIGVRRQFAQLRRVLPTTGPQLHGVGLCGAEFGQPRFRHVDHGFQFARHGHLDHHLPGLHHLSRLGIDVGHHTGALGSQRGIGLTVGADPEVGFGLAQFFAGDGHAVLAAVKVGLADELLAQQLAVAHEVGLLLGVVAAGGGKLGTLGGQLQPDVGRVQPHQRCSGTDLLADFDQPGVDLARHAKALFRFVARPDFGGIALDVCRVGRGHAGGAYRTGFFLGGRLVAAAREGGSQQAAQTDSGQGNGHG